MYEYASLLNFYTTEKITMNITQIKAKIIDCVLWAEKELKDKTGAEKKAAVIQKIDDMIKLPFYLEWLDDMLVSYFIDAVCTKLNAITQHNFKDLAMNEADEIKLAESIEEKKING